MIGLSTKLQECMVLITGGTFPEFINNIMIADDAIHAHKETKKRKVVTAPPASAPLNYRTVYHHSSTYPPQQLHQHQHQRPEQQWAPRLPHHQHQRAVPKALPPPPPVMRLRAPPTAGAASGHICFNCGRSGHVAQECTTPKGSVTQGHVSHSPRGPLKVAIAKTGRINYTAMEDIPEGEQILTGMFSLNGYPAIVMFDSGATHDFISKACIQKSQLAIQHMSTPYLIKTLGGKICTNQLVKNTSLNLGGKEYKTFLIVLEGQGIDIILGMGWMKAHKALLDTATRVVQLDSQIHGIHVLQLSSVPAATPSVHHTAAQNLEDSPVAYDFPDVFPVQDVEFVIELQPSMTLISKRPYKMTPKELAELKVQLNELLDKGYIRPSSSP
jgi:predicted aspartyl protease